MSVGPKPSLQALASGLDPTLLRLFVRDLLAEQGFRDIRDFDGVGDGGRDLEGTDRNGRVWIVQLKYRHDPSAGTSTNEFAELPMGLLRLGRTHGLFITNGRLTPAAKRDSSNAFPGLTLAFMEGIDLLDALQDAPITTALWASGVEMRYIQRKVRLGVVCRALPRDRSTFLDQLPELTPPDWNGLFGPETIAAVSITRGWFDYSDFEPFRPPQLITENEGSLDRVFASEIVIHGKWTLDQLAAVQHAVGANIASQWTGGDSGPATCAIRVSRPAVLAPGSEERLPADIRPVTIVGRAGNALLESVSLVESLGDWAKPSWIQVYQAMSGAYFLLHSQANLLCQLRYKAMTSRSELGQALRQRAYFDRWWDKSLFYFSSDKLATDEESEDPLAPAYCEPWEGGRWIVGWLHPRHHGKGAEYLLRGDERDANYDPLQESEDEVRYIETVLHLAASKGLTPLPAKAAYHALCFATEGDAAPSVMWRVHDTGKLLDFAQEVPSPIDVFDIDCEFSAAYIFDDPDKARATAAAWSASRNEEWRSRVTTGTSLPQGRAEIDFLAGDVDRALDERVVLICLSREFRARVSLGDRLQADGRVVGGLLDRLERAAGVPREARQSRRWLRDRWRVYFAPERPDPENQQIAFFRPDTPV